MTTVAPERSVRQRQDALARANRVRVKRAELKRDLKARKVDIAAVLAMPAPEIAGMKLHTLLRAVPGIGRVKAGKVIADAGISPRKTVGGLTARQRTKLAGVLGRRLARMPAMSAQASDAQGSPA